MTQAYPLQWPDGWPRTPDHRREDGRHRFKRGDWKGGYRFWSISEATAELLEELRKMGARNAVISTNLQLRNDGLPRSGQRQPDDPGVAVYFTLDSDPMVMARDAFARPEENLRSLCLAVQGLRQVDRHGGGQMFKRAFAGFTALPPPDQMSVLVTSPPRNWWDVLGVSPEAPWPVIKGAYRGLAMSTPEDQMAAINLAYEAAKKASAAA